MQTQYNNKGVIFPNRRKQGNQPDWTGKLTIDGKEDRLSGWIKKDKNGQSYISIARTPAEQVEAFRRKDNANVIVDDAGKEFSAEASGHANREADSDRIPF